jgi:hypothetical protein
VSRAWRAIFSHTHTHTHTHTPHTPIALNLIARLPGIAAAIYRHTYGKGDTISYDKTLDLGGNMARMMGWQSEGFEELMRLYLTCALVVVCRIFARTRALSPHHRLVGTRARQCVGAHDERCQLDSC